MFYTALLAFVFIFSNLIGNEELMFYVITGGPGSGKSTLIEALRERGYICVEEAGRQIIQEQIANGGDALPWANLVRFKELMLDHAITTYEQAKGFPGIVFFDRGVHDLIGYDRLTKTESTERLLDATKKMHYNKMVFLTPPWEEIYCNDAERKQTFQEAIDTYTKIRDAYREYDYEVIDLPKASVERRVEFIIDLIERNS